MDRLSVGIVIVDRPLRAAATKAVHRVKYHTFLSLLLVVGCPGSNELTTTTSDDSPSTGTSQASEATQTTVDPEVTSTTAPTGDSGEPDDSTSPSGTQGSASASQSGSSTAGATDNSGTGDTGDTDTTDTTGTGTTGEPGTTGGCMAQNGPDPVDLGDADDLGAAGAYLVLAKSAVTNVPGSTLTGGHIGVSPVAHTAITGFSLVLEPSGVYSTSSQLVAPGKVYAADYALPTPVKLTTAVLKMQAAYADAASRVPTDFLDLASGELGGLVLAPGIYTWGSTVLVSNDVTFEGCEDDVWILQISDDLDVSANKKVLLAGGARAENIFWQVAGQATIQAGAHLEGIVLAKTGIILQTKASMHGRVYAQTMVAFDKNAVTAP